MNEILVTWDAVIPYMFIERCFVGLIGIGMFAHFLCMANAAPTKSPNAVMLFLLAIAFSAAGMIATSVIGEINAMFTLLISGLGSMLLFWLWLWHEGLHVKDFLDKKYQ